jgi:glycosyltransferase involved in cell wall biosynthesis
LCYSALIIYYRQSWLQIKNYYPEPGKKNKNSTLITVIIAARNEEKTIGICIESIIEQTYPAHLFELIVIDDHSIDSTAAIVNSFNKKGNIRMLKLKDFNRTQILNSYKKKSCRNRNRIS